MIRSTEHGYLFVQLPHTGCSSVALELLEHYRGEKLLGKHATFREFERRQLGWKPSFVFSTVRHPLDDIVSSFEKLRTNHEQYDNPSRSISSPGGFVDEKARARFDFVQQGAGFDAYVRRFHRLPFDNWSSLDHHKFDRVMKFESLAEDFSSVLSDLGLEPVRSLPVRNATQRRRSSWEDYWADGDLRAFIGPRVAPFMHRWGYEFPEGWPLVPANRRLAFELVRKSLLPRRSRIWSQPAPVFAGD